MESTRTDRLLETFAAAPFGVMCVSGTEGRYLFVNAAFAAMVGRSVEELMVSDPYQIWIEVTHPDHLELERLELERMARGEVDHFALEKRMFRRPGEARWVSVDAFVARDAEGRLDVLTCYFTDIEEQRRVRLAHERLELELHRAQKLETLGKLAGGIAHDFNNRLVVIMGHAELIKHTMPASAPAANHAEIILESAQRAAELTRQLLAYGRRQVLMPRAFDLNASVDTMRRLLERLIGDQIELDTRLDAEHAVYSDPGQIEQVILNLVLNARDAMPEGGKLTLSTRDVRIESAEGPQPSGEYVVLQVTDTGAGISEDVLPRVFEPFFTTKEVGRGTGLGLATVEGIVHQSGGSVRVASAVGLGATFTIHLPRASSRPELRSAPVPSPVSSRVAFETVLVCDDDEGVLHLISNLLELRGYTVLRARSGRHALDVAAQHTGPLHLLVTDIVMPELGGVELARELRKRVPGLGVLYVSGYTEDTSTLSDSLDPGTHFLTKPFAPGDLTRAVCSMLEGTARDPAPDF